MWFLFYFEQIGCRNFTQIDKEDDKNTSRIFEFYKCSPKVILRLHALIFILWITLLHLRLCIHVCHIDVTRAISTWVSNLVSQNWTIGFGSKVDTKLVVELHASIFRVHVDHQLHGAFLAHVWVKLFVPW